jgi:hypothetical protein
LCASSAASCSASGVIERRVTHPHVAHQLQRRVAEMEAAGYRLQHEYTFLPRQFFLVFTPAT